MVQILGTAVSAPATAGILDVNVKNMNNVAATSITTVNAFQGTTVNPLFDSNSGIKADVIDWLGTAVTAATGGIPDVNAKNINNVSASSVTTINANLGTTQAIVFDGNNFQKVDLVDIAGTAVSAASAQLGVNVVNIGGSASQGPRRLRVGMSTGAKGIDNPTATVGLSGTTVGTVTAVTDQVTANVTDINAVSCSSVTTVAAVIGTTVAPLFDSNTCIKSDLVDIAGVAVNTATAQLGVNIVKIAGTASAGAAGYMGIDWNAIDNPTATVGLSGTTVGTITTYTGDTPQTGDSFARIGSTGSGLTSLAPAATALSTATWTSTRAGYLDNLSGGPVALEIEAVSIYNRLGAPAGASVSADIAALTVDVLAIPTTAAPTAAAIATAVSADTTERRSGYSRFNWIRDIIFQARCIHGHNECLYRSIIGQRARRQWQRPVGDGPPGKLHSWTSRVYTWQWCGASGKWTRCGSDRIGNLGQFRGNQRFES